MAREPSGPVRPFLHAEQALHLVPGRKHDHGREEAEDENRQPEPEAGAARRVTAFEPGPPPRALAPVGALDRERVERGILVIERGSGSACWLGHR